MTAKKIILLVAVPIAIFTSGIFACRLLVPEKNIQPQGETWQQPQKLGAREVIVINSPSGPVKVIAKIDTGADSSSIDMSFAKSIGFDTTTAREKMIVTSEGKDKRNVVDFNYVLGGKEIFSDATVESRSNLSTKVLVGRSDLGGFIIIPDEEFLAAPSI